MNALEDFVSAHLGLLKLEQESEVEESQKLLEGCSLKDLQSKGVALLGLIIASRKTGMFRYSSVYCIQFFSEATFSHTQ